MVETNLTIGLPEGALDKYVAERPEKTEKPSIVKNNYFDHKKPQFPVINPSPETELSLAAIRWSDVGWAGFATAFTYGFGYVVAPYPRTKLRGPTAAVASTIGLTFGVMFAFQNTWQRLMGYSENAREVKKFGTYPKKM
mmetsp:Transcript_35596/g.70069  ORF Transcript_35596/g.70069 Transcript_35596/m.70069 type:complete len:139 (-) Transcript_35596:100-516(-)|eukprot:CAMPEP_0194323352 /NCGR_PEP_ID=MMETSP0171-20130528/25388_1 /TAXON_ID=218684 /ORGANISM="Corethron pennatum, Strain L29A3" /LENGTH=138 /DNA_ID=CAMNT_0039081979 /DNA_START=123 /DNA_END=539 /DNA_ORIENTATION=-